jgi:hypothetical protein
MIQLRRVILFGVHIDIRFISAYIDRALIKT